jgi:hypothetical protein
MTDDKEGNKSNAVSVRKCEVKMTLSHAQKDIRYFCGTFENCETLLSYSIVEE